MHVLVVDDDRLVRWALAETLTAGGYDVTEVCDAHSAIQACDADCPADLILLDLWLPDADDLSVLSFIRMRLPNTPVILMTAFGTPEIVDQATALGAVVLAKPFDMSDLAGLVDRTVRARAG
jgi:DNA-binding NtrC family response regulator